MNSEYQKFGRENLESGASALNSGHPDSLRDAFRNLWEAYENFLDGILPSDGLTIRERNDAFEDMLIGRGLLDHFIERVLRVPEAGLLADLQPRIFHEQSFQQTHKQRTDEHDAYTSDYDRIRSGRRPKRPIARLLNLLSVIRNNLQHGQKILPEEWPEMRQRNLEIFSLVAPVQHQVVLGLFETVWTDGVFAYGTLRAESTRFELVRDLAKAASDKYFVSGKLYDLGDYPGLVLGSGDKVPGEMLRSDRLQELLLRIDGIEGRDFTRRMYWVTRAGDSGERSLAWIYEYRGHTSGVPRCKGGMWPRIAESGT